MRFVLSDKHGTTTPTYCHKTSQRHLRAAQCDARRWRVYKCLSPNIARTTAPHSVAPAASAAIVDRIDSDAVSGECPWLDCEACARDIHSMVLVALMCNQANRMDVTVLQASLRLRNPSHTELYKSARRSQSAPGLSTIRCWNAPAAATSPP